MFNGMEYVYEVYKEKSFSKAAQNLYISQPSLSATIKKIETRIGVPIFDRSTNPIRLTECGEEYLKSIEKIMDVKNEFSNYLNESDQLKIGQIAIGASNYFASYVLPHVITEFTKQYPLVKINLTEANTPLLEDHLINGSLDLIIDYNTLNDSVYTKHALCEEHLLLAVPKVFNSNQSAASYQLSIGDIMNGRHLDKNTKPVPLSLFTDEPFLFLRSGNNTRKHADMICQMQDFTPHVTLKLDQQVTAFNLASYGMGITFTSDYLIRKNPSNTNLVYYKLDGEAATRTVYYYHKQSRYITRAMEEFLKIATGR